MAVVLVDPRKPRLEIAESEGFMTEKLPSLSPESNRQRKRGASARVCLGKPVP
jgi:hypothetical protein